MRWLGFAIVAVIALTLQTSVAWRFQIGDARPDWMLVLAVYFALHAKSEEGLIAACVLGALADLMSIERFGLLTLLYGLAALSLYVVRDFFFVDHPLTHFFLTWAPAMGIAAASHVYRAVVVGAAPHGLGFSLLEIVFASAYVAVWAVPIHWALARFPRFLGVRVSRSRASRGSSLRPKHV